MNYKDFFQLLKKMTNEKLGNEARFLIEGEKLTSSQFHINGPFGQQVFIKGDQRYGCTGIDMLSKLASIDTCILPKKKREVNLDIANDPVLFVHNDIAYEVTGLSIAGVKGIDIWIDITTEKR